MNRIVRWTVAALLVVPCAAPATTGNHTCPEPDPGKRVVFNHYEGAVLGPSPAVLELKDGEVFEVRFCETLPSRFDYEISPIDADKERKASFKSPETSAIVDRGQLTTTGLSWKHREEFSLYQVSVTVRGSEENPEIQDPLQVKESKRDMLPEDSAQEQVFLESFGLGDEEEFFDLSARQLRERLEQQRRDVPETLRPVYLYSYTFPVWVKTVSWKVSFTSGLAFSDLQDPKFFIQTNGQETDAGPDDAETGDTGNGDAGEDLRRVRRDRGAEGDSRPDLVLFANLVTPDAGWWSGLSGKRTDEDEDNGAKKSRGWRRSLGGRLGLAFGLGLNGDGEARYYFGPSWTIGRKDHFVVAAGWTGGEVDRLPGKQALDAPPIDDNVLNELNSSFEHGFFAGLTFNFNPRQRQEFASALNGKAGRTDEGGGEPAPKPEEEEGEGEAGKAGEGEGEEEEAGEDDQQAEGGPGEESTGER